MGEKDLHKTRTALNTRRYLSSVSDALESRIGCDSDETCSEKHFIIVHQDVAWDSNLSSRLTRQRIFINLGLFPPVTFDLTAPLTNSAFCYVSARLVHYGPEVRSHPDLVNLHLLSFQLLYCSKRFKSIPFQNRKWLNRRRKKSNFWDVPSLARNTQYADTIAWPTFYISACIHELQWW